MMGLVLLEKMVLYLGILIPSKKKAYFSSKALAASEHKTASRILTQQSNATMTHKNLNIGNLQDAQGDMRNGYGSIGVFISGIVWVFSSLLVNYHSSQKGIWTLIIGGMFIFPIATLFGKLMGIKGGHQKNNPFSKLAMEGTLWMIMCISLAYGLSLIKVEWFFQGMMMIIAGRHLTFATIYGIRLYWVLGIILGLAAYALFRMEAGGFPSASTGGLIEIIFGVVIYGFYRYDKQKI